MDILPKLEWCCVEILDGSSSFRSILTLQEIQQNNFTGDEIGENIISEGLAGKTLKIFIFKIERRKSGARVKIIFPRSVLKQTVGK